LCIRHYLSNHLGFTGKKYYAHNLNYFSIKEKNMIITLLAIIGIVVLICLFGAIACLLAAYRECQLPDIEDIEVVEEVV
jgi:hypothetical protein